MPLEPGKLIPGSIYCLHPAYVREISGIKALKDKTGKTLEEWISFIKEEGPSDFKAMEAWLKTDHGITTNYASWLVEHAKGEGGIDNYKPEEYVDKQYSGKKEHLRPLYDTMLAFGLELGSDVRVCPCETIVPFFRDHVFAQLKPSTNSRIDLGLALPHEPFTQRVLDTGGLAKKDRITHRIAITCAEDFDAEAKDWFRRAYEYNK